MYLFHLKFVLICFFMINYFIEIFQATKLGKISNKEKNYHLLGAFQMVA